MLFTAVFGVGKQCKPLILLICIFVGGIHNPEVPGSIPGIATIKFNYLLTFLAVSHYRVQPILQRYRKFERHGRTDELGPGVHT